MNNWSVCIFAHNEQDHIRNAIESILKNVQSLDVRTSLHVILNGSTDGTSEIVRALCQTYPAVVLHELALGDKANAWNHYVHQVAGDADLHFFCDGDLTVAPGSFSQLANTCLAHPEALLIPSIAAGGLSETRYARHQIQHNGMSAFYAVSKETLAKFRATKLVLPVGLIGDDSLLIWLCKNRFAPEKLALDESAVSICESASFKMEPRLYWRPDGALEHIRRQRRYAIRQLQLERLLPILRKKGMTALPVDINAVFEGEGMFSLVKDHLANPFYWAAALRILRTRLS